MKSPFPLELRLQLRMVMWLPFDVNGRGIRDRAYGGAIEVGEVVSGVRFAKFQILDDDVLRRNVGWN